MIGYRVARRANFEGAFEVVGNVSPSALDFLDADLEPETFYGYRLTALLDLGRTSSPSVVAGARTAPAPGIEVSTSTSAPNPASSDPDGYLVEVLGPSDETVASGVVAATGKRRFGPLAPGAYKVRISDVRSTCNLQGPPVRDVTVAGTGLQTLAPVSFAVVCRDPLRAELNATVRVEGDTLQAAPFRVMLTGVVDTTAVAQSTQVAPSGGTAVFFNLLPGTYQVELRQLDPICTLVSPTQSRNITLAASGIATEEFVVECLRPGGGVGIPLKARWKDAQGGAIGFAQVGVTVFLDLTVELGDSTSLQTLQGSVDFDARLLEPLAAAALDLGAGDDLDQFTAGSLTGSSINLQTFSIQTAPNSGTQGVARVTFRTKAQGTARIGFRTQIATNFDDQRVVLALDAQPLTIGTAQPSPPAAVPGGPYTGTVGIPVAFDGSGSFDPDGGALTSYSWTFGDGGTASGARPSHTYAAEGTFTVELTVTDDEGVSTTATTTATIAAQGTGPRITGGWTNAAGSPITSIGVGETAVLEICTTESRVQAYQADLGWNAAVASITALDEFNAASAKVAICVGSNDVLDQFTKAALTGNPVNHQNFSLAASPGTGPQGLAVARFQTTSAGTLRPTLDVSVFSIFSGSGPASGTPVVELPSLTVGSGGGGGGGGGGGTLPPAANVGGPYSGAVGTAVTFDGSGSAPGDAPIVRYRWSFGDGTPVDSTSGATPSHTYASAGTYTVILAVLDQGGLVDADTTTAVISGTAIATYAWSNTWSRPNGNPGERVALSTRVHPGVALRAVQGRLRVDPSVLRLDSIRQGPAWTFAFSAQAEPDGTVTLSASAGQATSGAAPVEVATLHYTIVGGNGTGSTTQTANVVLLDGSLRPVGLAGLGITEATFAVGAPNQLPVARANGPYAGFLGAGISFSAAGSYDPDGQITAFEWTFGDGAAATGAAPRHFYRTVGTYTAVLTTRDNRGAVARDSAQVTVVEPSSFAWKAAWSRGTAGPAPAGGPLAAPLQTRPDSAGPGDAVSLRLTSRPGIAYQAISARVEWDPDVVRFDSVSAGSLATGTFQGTLATDSSLDIYARASNPQAGTSEAHVATAYFTVNAVEGSSTITSSSAVQLFDGAGGPLDVTNLPILESTLLVAECCDPTVLPVARAGGPYSGAVGAPLTLSGAASTGAISTYAWDFGDGDTGTGVSPTHTYAAAGTFQVVLTVSGAGGTDSDTTTVTVGLVPVANAGGPYIGTAGPAVSLDGTGSTGTITSYSWTLGDGTSSTLPDPSHRYACPSTYQAVLTVSGPGGTSSDTTSVTIAGALSGANILGCWTDASGVPIVRATPGQSVILEVCTPVADTEAIQGRIGHDDLLVSRSSMADLDASSARTPVCMGADDRLSQFTGSTSPSENPGQFQTFSLSGAGSGPQGVVKITYVVAAGASGTLIPSWFLQLWSTSTSAAPSQILADIPALEIAP